MNENIANKLILNVSHTVGSDSNCGSEDYPVRTIARAMEIIGDKQDAVIRIIDTERSDSHLQYDCQKKHLGTITFEGITDQNVLEQGSVIGFADDIHLCGPTVFKNITFLFDIKQSQNRYIYTNGYKLRLEGYIGAKMRNENGEYTEKQYIGIVNQSGAQKHDVVISTNGVDGNSRLGDVIVAQGVDEDRHSYTVRFANDTGKQIYVNNIYLQGSSVETAHFGNINLITNTSIGVLYGATNSQYNKLKLSEDCSVAASVNAFQVIYNNGAHDAHAFDFSITDNLTIDTGLWYICCEKKIGCSLDVTETAGKFKAYCDSDVYAFRESDGERFKSDEDGYLTLPPLNIDGATPDCYHVVFGSQAHYTNDKSLIRIYDDCVIDFSDEKINTYSNRIFCGWKVSGKNEYPQSKSERIPAGTILEAEYVDLPSDRLRIENATIESCDEISMKFALLVSDDIFNVLKPFNKTECGFVYIKSDCLFGRELLLDREYDDRICPNKKTVEINQDDRGITEQLYIRHLGPDDYNCYYMVRGYIRYTDFNGVIRTIYSNECHTSPYRIAKDCVDNSSLNSELFKSIIAVVEEKRKEYLLNELSGREFISGYDENGCITDANKCMYKLGNGLWVRNIEIPWQYAGTPEQNIHIIAFADCHMATWNDKDIEIGNPALMSTIENFMEQRQHLRLEYSVPKINKCLRYAECFDQTIVMGDVIDFLSYGGLHAIKTVIVDKDPSAILTVGNHELRRMNGGTVAETAEGLKENKRIVNENWHWNGNDSKFLSRIVHNSVGQKMAMVLALDNSDVSINYDISLLEKIKRCFEEARKKKLPVLIFQHFPISTRNYDDEQNGRFPEYIGTDGLIKEDEDYADYYCGSSSDNSQSKSVYDYIVNSADIVKGIFCGHTHTNHYTEICGYDHIRSEAVKIPQYIVGGTCGNKNSDTTVLDICVKGL